MIKKILMYLLAAIGMLGIASALGISITVNNENKTIEEKINVIETKLSDLFDDNLVLTNSLNNLLTKDEIKDSDIESLKNAVNVLLDNISKLEAELKDLEMSDNSSLLEEIESLKASTELLKNELNNLKGEIEAEKIHHFAIVGSMNDWNVKDQTYLMNSDDDIVFTYTLEVNEAVEFKITDNMAWEWQYGPDAVKSKGNYLASNDGNIKLLYPGKYDLTLNCETHEVLIDINEINLENYVETNNFTLVGSMNGWYVDNTEHPFTSNNDYTYTYTFNNYSESVEFKLVNNASWDSCFGKEAVSTTAEWLDLQGENIKILTPGKYFIKFDYLRNNISIEYVGIFEKIDPVITIDMEDGAVFTPGIFNISVLNITVSPYFEYDVKILDENGSWLMNFDNTIPGKYRILISVPPRDFNNHANISRDFIILNEYANYENEYSIEDMSQWGLYVLDPNSDNYNSYVSLPLKSTSTDGIGHVETLEDNSSGFGKIFYADHISLWNLDTHNYNMGISYTFTETLNIIYDFSANNGGDFNYFIDLRNSYNESYFNNIDVNTLPLRFNIQGNLMVVPGDTLYFILDPLNEIGITSLYFDFRIYANKKQSPNIDVNLDDGVSFVTGDFNLPEINVFKDLEYNVVYLDENDNEIEFDNTVPGFYKLKVIVPETEYYGYSEKIINFIILETYADYTSELSNEDSSPWTYQRTQFNKINVDNVMLSNGVMIYSSGKNYYYFGDTIDDTYKTLLELHSDSVFFQPFEDNIYSLLLGYTFTEDISIKIKVNLGNFFTATDKVYDYMILIDNDLDDTSFTFDILEYVQNITIAQSEEYSIHFEYDFKAGETLYFVLTPQSFGSLDFAFTLCK